MPGKQFIEAVDLVIRDAAKNVSEPSLRIDAVEFGGFDQTIGDGRRLSTALGSHEEIIFPAQTDGSHGSLSRIVVELQKAVIEPWSQLLHSNQGIADGLGKG